jgi:hypothetical protein
LKRIGTVRLTCGPANSAGGAGKGSARQDLHQADPGSILVAGNGNFAALGPTKSK